jgi:hypothetical protein
MALKVIAKRLIGDGLEVACEMRADPVPRVRSEAERMIAKLTADEA